VRAQPSLALVAGTVRLSPPAVGRASARAERACVRVVGPMPTADRRVLSLHARGHVLGSTPGGGHGAAGRDVRLGRGTADAPKPPPTCAGRGVRWPLHSPHQSCAAVVRQAGACTAYNPYNPYNRSTPTATTR
jgi:hypothetical protein